MTSTSKPARSIVDFGGWDMPLHYGSQKEEHHAVRQHAGVFDVSHMTIVDLSGERVREFLRQLLANDVARLPVERQGALHLHAERAGRGHRRPDRLLSRRHATTAWWSMPPPAKRTSPGYGSRPGIRRNVSERAELAMIAVQGPKARELAAPCIDAEWRDAALELKPFHGMEAGEWFVARTGYTGEDGWEIVMPGADAPALWDRLLAAGVQPCGLGARDTLRLEAAMNLYGNDMDETVSPLESGLGWTVAWEPADRDFIGPRSARASSARKAIRAASLGLLLEDKGVLRDHQRVVVDGVGEGEITSGGFSPTIGRSIALARLPAGDYDRAQVDVRGKLLNVRVVEDAVRAQWTNPHRRLTSVHLKRRQTTGESER